VRENRSHGSEGGEAQTFPTPIGFPAVHTASLQDVGGRNESGHGGTKRGALVCSTIV